MDLRPYLSIEYEKAIGAQDAQSLNLWYPLQIGSTTSPKSGCSIFDKKCLVLGGSSFELEYALIAINPRSTMIQNIRNGESAFYVSNKYIY